MIRIDEIYNNIFLPLVRDKKDVGLHWFDPFGSVRIEHMINLPPVDGTAVQRLVFWDQEPVYRHTFSRFMDDYKKMYLGPTKIVTSERESLDLNWAQDTYGVTHAYYFFHGWAALDWYRGYNHSFLWPQWLDRTLSVRIFCANNIIGGERTHRLRLISGMSHRNLITGNHISMPAYCPYSGESADDLCDRIGVKRIPEVPLVIDRPVNHANHSHNLDVWPWAVQSFCHVVTETVYLSQRLHLTEKTFKPIVLQQPFVLVAPRGSLSYLRSYGFETFSDIWDESYDDLDDESRIDAILDLLQDINSWSWHKIQHKQKTIMDRVKHNHDWFYGGFQDVLWHELQDMVSNLT
jgi:hypothetical protein